MGNEKNILVCQRIPWRDFGQRCKRVSVDNLEIYEHSLVFCSVQTFFAAKEQNQSEKDDDFTN